MNCKAGFRSLGPGSAVALVAPAGPFEAESYEKGASVLRSAGYAVVPGRNAFKKQGYLAGTDRDRIEDLTEAVLDPAIEAIICIRGGYGSGRLLPRIPFQSFRGNPKPFIGFSDITFLHLGLASMAGWTTFHGPNLVGMNAVAQRAESVLDVLSGKASFHWTFGPEQVLRPGRVEGPVLGGNLSCLTRLIGTVYMPDLAGALLLIEDCSEALYRLDRMMNHLELASVLPTLGAILLGDFDRCARESDICAMIMDHVSDYDFPVVRGLPFGHGERNDVIPLGPPFLLDTNERVLAILETPFVR
ncbi:MAG: LD-carboxypeptidase [Deltaproteobacteria bacterium]|jgi:muramoyltetrapeptide carboxypeptidase|nr:LD-carboxypeptidase [Deltaproteobacteria bacterium]